MSRMGDERSRASPQLVSVHNELLVHFGPIILWNGQRFQTSVGFHTRARLWRALGNIGGPRRMASGTDE